MQGGDPIGLELPTCAVEFTIGRTGDQGREAGQLALAIFPIGRAFVQVAIGPATIQAVARAERDLHSIH